MPLPRFTGAEGTTEVTQPSRARRMWTPAEVDPGHPDRQLQGFHAQTQTDQTWSPLHSELTGDLDRSLTGPPNSIPFCFTRRGVTAPKYPPG